MKYMGWNFDDLMLLPGNYYLALIQMVKDEHDRIAAATEGE